MSFSGGKQMVRPPQRGIFPLDHDAECKPMVQVGLPRWRKEYCNTHCPCYPWAIAIFLSFLRSVILFLLIYWWINSNLSILQKYLDCLKDSQDVHHKCKEFSRDYLQCRMDRQLMAKEDLNDVSFALSWRIERIFKWRILLFIGPPNYFTVTYRWGSQRKPKWRGLERTTERRKSKGSWLENTSIKSQIGGFSDPRKGGQDEDRVVASSWYWLSGAVWWFVSISARHKIQVGGRCSCERSPWLGFKASPWSPIYHIHRI